MNVQSDLSVLLSNIIDEKHFSHCRLCLTNIDDNNFARFNDGVLSNDEYFIIYDVITKIFGEEACEQIPGVNAVCNKCVKKAIDTVHFINLYKECTQKLHKLIDNLNTTLYQSFNVSDFQKLYIKCEEDEAKLIFVQNEVKLPQKTYHNKCSICNNTFESLVDFVEHNEQDHGTNTCVKCSYTSDNMDDITQHEESEESFKCKSCPQQRCTEASLQEHTDENHGEYICKQCGKKFGKYLKLLKHEEKHVESYVCTKCGKTYVTKDFYNKHMALCLEDKVELHPRRSEFQKKYFCQECGKGYSTPGALRVHIRFVHENAKPHVCKECGKKFTAPCFLKAHMVTHTKEKNFPCETCGGKFVSKEALLYHIRRHTGERPYSCDKCDERFVNASARAEHIKFKHIGPTIRCELCSRMFVTKNFLRLHMKKHQDPANKLYIGRANAPPNLPGEQNKRLRNDII